MKKNWIKILPPGEYDMKELKKITGLKSLTSIKGVMIRHGAKINTVNVEHSNMIKNVFIWPGFKDKISRKKIPSDF